MPVSTRSQIAVLEQKHGPNLENEARTGTDPEDAASLVHPLRNPHHRLKEKMKVLTLQYEQQKQALMAAKKNNQSCLHTDESRFSSHPSADLLAPSNKENPKEISDPRSPVNVLKRANHAIPKLAVRNSFVLRPPADDAKENMAPQQLPQLAPNRIVGFSCPRNSSAKAATTATSRLSMIGLGAAAQSEPRGFGGGGNHKNIQEADAASRKERIVSRIKVFVRLRPMGRKEEEAGSRCCVKIVNSRDVYITEFAHENDYLRLKRLRGQHFTFDASFPDSTTQHEVYSTSTAELVEAVLQGRNGTVFCYGATGAGKTYTMLGTAENPGVMVLAIKDLFHKVRQRSFDGNHTVHVHLSYLEVYNETVRDLLSPGRPLVIREDKQGIVAAGLSQYRAHSTDEVMALLQQGNLNRTTEPTRANETSSRSHAILLVVVEYCINDALMNTVKQVGKLSLIDLAGSERALATDQRTLRSVEGANINRSLLALSSCINALVEGKKHTPYRNFKLTQLLKDSLGEVCNTVMIANISPNSLSFDETQNTLYWADRAKKIRTKVSETANEEILNLPESETDRAKLLLEVQKENRELRVQLARLQQKLLTVQAQSMAANASSPAPSAVTGFLTPPPSSAKGKHKSSFLGSNCFKLDSKRRHDEEIVKELRQTIKELEEDMQKLKRGHGLQLKQKDEYIREVSKKGMPPSSQMVGETVKRVVTWSHMRPKSTSIGELKSPAHRFLSPAPTAKKRSFWDITASNSPAVTLKGRKPKTHVEGAQAPSMLLQVNSAWVCSTKDQTLEVINRGASKWRKKKRIIKIQLGHGTSRLIPGWQ